MSVATVDMFDFFNLNPEEYGVNKKEKKADDKAKKEKDTSGNKKSEWEVEITLPITIRYLDFVKILTEIEFEQKTSVTLEEIREKLELQFPELEKGKCNLVFYKEKNFLVPVIKNGERKG